MGKCGSLRALIGALRVLLELAAKADGIDPEQFIALDNATAPKNENASLRMNTHFLAPRITFAVAGIEVTPESWSFMGGPSGGRDILSRGKQVGDGRARDS